MAAYQNREHRSMVDEAHVKEGFLCPMCMEDLCSFRNLQNHFDLKHSNEDKDVMNQIKGVFARAKDKFFNRDYVGNEQNLLYHSSPGELKSTYMELDVVSWEPQDLGAFKHNMDKFRCIRDARIDRTVVETNKIVIRLEKILQVSETDQTKRKAYEQSLVPWVEDEDVPFCPSCGDKFIVTRRRHHCRLCGAIMCGKCSVFLSVREAEVLTKKSKPANQDYSTSNKDMSQSSTPKLSEEESDKIYVRVCYQCDEVLQRNMERFNLQMNTTLLFMLHRKMRIAMETAEKSCPEFLTMAQSLGNGEEEYKLDLANEKRLRLMQMFEAVDVISKKIAILYLEDEENPPSLGAVRLQNAIRKAACSFLQDNMLSLPSLPSATKLSVLQSRRRAENERRLRMQREEAQRLRQEKRKRLEAEKNSAQTAENFEQVSYNPSNEPNESVSAAVADNPGWSSEPVSMRNIKSERRKSDGTMSDFSTDEKLGPLLEQITYVEESMKQAVAADMQTEAESLKKNLGELKLEYQKLKTARAFAVVDISQEEPNTSPFQPASENNFTSFPNVYGDRGEDVMLQQIEYITRCITEAKAAQKHDEVKILTENLEEIKQIYNRSL